MFLVLHGQTEWNRVRRMQGQRDSALTEEGRRQARSVGDLLKARLDAPPRIIASPLGRAQATAQIVAACLDVPADAIETDERLKELGFGAWEGLTREEIAEGWGVRSDDRMHNEWVFQAPDGETYEALAARLGEWLAAQTEPEGLIAVSHGVASRVLRGLYAGLSKADALALEVSRDTAYRLRRGQITELKAS